MPNFPLSSTEETDLWSTKSPEDLKAGIAKKAMEDLEEIVSDPNSDLTLLLQFHVFYRQVLGDRRLGRLYQKIWYELHDLEEKSDDKH